MATTYPGAKQTFTNAAGTQLLSNPDHATTHATVQDTIAAIEDTVGTTAGTNVLKLHTAGDLAARWRGGTVYLGSNQASAIVGVGSAAASSQVVIHGGIGQPGSLTVDTAFVEVAPSVALRTNTLNETTAASGVTIDSLLIKDGSIQTANSIPGSALSTSANKLAFTSFIGTQTGTAPTAISVNAAGTYTNPPGGRLLRFTAYVAAMSNTQATDTITYLTLWNGPVTTGTQLSQCNFNVGTSGNGGAGGMVTWVGTMPTGLGTVSLGLNAIAGTFTIATTATQQGYILVELI